MKFRNDGWNKSLDYTPKGSFWRGQLLIILLLLVGVIVAFMSANSAKAETVKAPLEITSIYWSDADSGRINGSLKFRLNSIDAPETGGVGAAIGGAKCELERERGYDAKEWIVSLTRGSELSITEEYGLDKYDRLVVDLSANGEDVGFTGVNAGHLRMWPHKGRRALVKKPDWCSR